MTGPRRVYVRVRMTPEESGRLTDMAHAWGFRTTAEFIRASLGRIGQLADEMRHMEKCQAATLGAMRDDIARLQRTEHVLFAMLENLAKTILTTIPPLPAESKPAAIAHGRAAYERYLKAVGMSLNNESKATMENLTDLDFKGVEGRLNDCEQP